MTQQIIAAGIHREYKIVSLVSRGCWSLEESPHNLKRCYLDMRRLMKKNAFTTRHKPLLAREGDRTERDYWGNLSHLIPHYQIFWREHIFPLRQTGQVLLR